LKIYVIYPIIWQLEHNAIFPKQPNFTTHGGPTVEVYRSAAKLVCLCFLALTVLAPVCLIAGDSNLQTDTGTVRVPQGPISLEEALAIAR